MLHFLQWILKHPVSVLLSVVVVILVGLVSLFRIPIEIKPEQVGQGIQIVANWKRHTPETVQRLITQPLEDIAIQLREVVSVESSSGIGRAIVQLEFPKDTELKYVYIELQERLATIKEKLPEDAFFRIEPKFADDEAQKAFSQAFFEVELIGSIPLNELRRVATEKVLPRLNGIDGVGKLELYGGSDGFIQILLNDELMKTLSIDPETVHAQLNSWAVNKGFGSIRSGRQNQLLALDSRPKSIHAFNHIPIRNGITLGDISDISFGYEAQGTLSRHNFKPLVLIRIFKTPGTNTLVFAEAIKNKIDSIQDELSSGISLRIASDSSTELRAELKSLAVRSAAILSVVFTILFILFRRLIHSTLILLVVFLSIVSTAIFLFWSGYTINVVTLAGIALVFGMLVDNAIVVMENIQRYRWEGRSDFGSGIRGTLEVFQPLLASTGTTVFVFFALLLLEDRLGAYYKPLAFVLGFSLVTSLLIAVVLIPAIFIRWPGLMAGHRKTKWGAAGGRWYSALLTFLISWRKSTIAFVLLVFALTAGLFWQNIDKGGFFSWGNKEKLSVYVDAPKGVTLEVLDDITRNFERVIQNQNVKCETQSIVDEANGYGYINVTFSDSLLNSVTPFVMKEYLISEAVNYAGVGISISGFGMPYWNGGYKVRTMYNTNLQIIGPDYYRLWEIGENILELAKADPRVNEGIISPSSRSLYQSDLKEITFAAHTDKIWANRFSIASVKNAAQKLFMNHSSKQEAVMGEKRYPLQIRYGEETPELKSLKNSLIHINLNRAMPVSDYFSVTQNTIQPWIDKKNQQYRFTVAWQYRGPERMRSRHEKSIVESLALPPGYKLEEKNWWFLTQKEESTLFILLGFVGLGIFMILAALYESFAKPFIIFFSVPFALVGVFLFYVLFGRDFNVNGYIGLILLFGVVVNNSIVLVERINQLKRTGLSTIEAAVKGGVDRIRPILITTLTTIGGLVPLVFFPTGNTAMAQILEELSFITIGGLVGSTLLTITMIPVVYVLIQKRLDHG